jgi:hypothetical protein
MSTNTHRSQEVKSSVRADRLFRKFTNIISEPEPKTLEELERRAYRTLRAIKNLRIEIGDSDNFACIENIYVELLNDLDKVENWDDVGAALDRWNVRNQTCEREASI